MRVTGKVAMALALGGFLLSGQAEAQIVTEDRELRGCVGFTNQILVPPALVPGSGQVLGRSITLATPLNNSGPIFDGDCPSPFLNHKVVVSSFSPPGGAPDNYWLTALLNAGSQLYRFGYAANSFMAPGYPDFINEVYRPTTRLVTPASPNPVSGVDLRECAGRIRVHLIEADPDHPGTYRGVTRSLAGVTITAYPRADPHEAGPPFSYHGSDISDISGGAQAQGAISSGNQQVDLYVRSSDQAGGPQIRYQVRVDASVFCHDINPDCPNLPFSVGSVSNYEGLTGDFGSLGAGGIHSPPGENSGLVVACDESQDLFAVLPPCVVPPCPPPLGTYQGCVNLIGEKEVPFGDRTEVQDFSTFPPHRHVSNIDPPNDPAPFTNLFTAFDPANEEGIYQVPGATGVAQTLRSFFALGLVEGTPQNLLDSPQVTTGPPPANGTVLGPDFCMVPGVYHGTVTLRDSSPSGSPAGSVESLDRANSFLYAFGPAGGLATRDFRSGIYNPDTGVYGISYENIFANPSVYPGGSWSQPRMYHRFRDDSTDTTKFTTGQSRIEFSKPTGEILWNPFDWISTEQGGTWTGALLGGSRIAERPARVIPLDYDLCYSTMRIQINSANTRFFNPRITQYFGAFQDDHGTPGEPSDDVGYAVFPNQAWEGSPRTLSDSARTGFVNLQLPQGNYTDIRGVITTDLGGGLTGETDLPGIDAVVLGCGESCTATPDAIVCLSPISRCNDPAILATSQGSELGNVDITGALTHSRPIASGFYRVSNPGGVSEVPFDFSSVVVDPPVPCGPAPCSDRFRVNVRGFGNCHNQIEIGFTDVEGSTISAFLGTTVDTTPPVFHANPAIDPSSPEFVCGSEVHFSPPSSCSSVPTMTVPLPVATDNCTPELPLTVTNTAPALLPFGTTVVQMQAVDSCGNGRICDARVVIEDTTPPSVTCNGALAPAPPPIGYSLSAGGNCRARQIVSASIGDNCDASVDLAVTNHVTLPDGTSLPPAAGPTVDLDFPLGISTVAFTVTDAHGNSSTCNVGVRVFDQTPPDLICPYVGTASAVPEEVAALRVSTSSSLSWTSQDLTAGLSTSYDIVTGTIANLRQDRNFSRATCLAAAVPDTPHTDSRPNPALGQVYYYLLRAVNPLGSGGYGNTPLRMALDGDAPCPRSDFIGLFECDNRSPQGGQVSMLATVSDNCGVRSFSNTFTGATLDASGIYPLGFTAVTYTAFDDSGNVSHCVPKLRVVDTRPPAIDCPDPLTLECPGPAGTTSADPAIQAWAASATAVDICDGSSLSSAIPASFPTSCLSSPNPVPVNFAATDSFGNGSTCTSTVTVADRTPPTITFCPPPLEVDAGSADGVPSFSPEIEDWLGTVSAQDSCGSAVTGDDAAFFLAGCGSGVTTPVIFTAADACSNLGSCSSSVTVFKLATREICDGLDNDCDGQVDEGLSNCDTPRTIGFYKRLCAGPHPEDDLTQANADCVRQSSTFSFVTSVADVCAVLTPDPANDKCEQAESQLMAALLNRCKQRLSDSEAINSVCSTQTTVGGSISNADMLLSDPARNHETCTLAQCECEELNTGAALVN